MQEREFKYMMTERDFRRVVENRKLVANTQINYYFYSPNENYSKKYAVRVREKNNAFQLTAKIRISAENGLFLSSEHNASISREAFENFKTNGIPSSEVSRFLGIEFEWDLDFAGTLLTKRHVLKTDGLTLEFDENEYLGKTDFELECELDPADDAKFRDFTAAENLRLTPSNNSKIQRFFIALSKS